MAQAQSIKVTVMQILDAALKELKDFGHALPVGGMLGTIAYVINTYVGIDPMVYTIFILLFMVDFFTGLRAAKISRGGITSQKLPNTAIKMTVYSFVLVALNVYSTKIVWPVIFGASLNMFQWIYWITFLSIALTQFYSIFENLRDIGFKESKKVLEFMDSFLSSSWKKIFKRSKE